MQSDESNELTDNKEIMKLMVFTPVGILFFKEEDWENAKESAKEHNTHVRLV